MEGARRSNLVIIQGVSKANAGKVFKAHLTEQISYDINLHWDTIFKDVLDWRRGINQVLAGAGAMPVVGDLALKAQDFMGGLLSQGLAWTRKFGGIPEHVDFDLKCRLWVEHSRDEVMRELKNLYDMVIPEMSEGALAAVEQLVVSVSVGGWFLLEQAIVERVSHEWSAVMVEGVPAWCDVSIRVSTLYAIDRSRWNVAGDKITVRAVS